MPEFAESYWLWLLLLLPLVVWLRIKARIAEAGFKRVVGTILRCVGIVLLVVALAGPLEQSLSTHPDIVFVLDVSQSIDQDTAQAAQKFINVTLASMNPQAHAGLVVFGADPAVERLLSESRIPFADVSVEVNQGGTDIAHAIEVAVGTFKTDGQRRVVLLTDGQENLGQALAAAQVARSVGVLIDTVALQNRSRSDEILIHDIAAPRWVRQQEPFDLDISIASQTPARGHLVITRNGSLLHEEMLVLQPGSNTYTIVDQAHTPGLYEYEAIINSDQDQVHENNRYQTFIQVKGAAKVLHAVGDATSGNFVTSALREQGLLVEEIAGAGLPTSMHELVKYDLIILNNVPALDMSLVKMQIIEDYVRDTGGGLIIFGGDKSYGAGGYLGTPIERALPVSMDIKTEVDIPSLALTLIIDKSGSMSSREKLAIAKDAAYSTLQILYPVDTVGILAFSNTSEWLVPPREVGGRRAIVERLRQLKSGGGTDLYAALKEAHRVMRMQSARIKHLILLSDGLNETDADVLRLVKRISKDRITLSSVAFGGDADQSLMETIAAEGGGRYYYTKDAENVPRIFTSETLIVARNLFVEEDVRPLLQYPGELLKGFDPNAFPMVSGYQRIFAKPAAQVLLSVGAQEPLLASWRYGLGRSVAFSSDLSGRWARQWINWDEFSRFVAQTARWTMRKHGSARLLPQFRRLGQRAEIIVDALDHDDQFVNGIQLDGTVVDPARATGKINFQQISPGRYRSEFEVPQEGRYYINLSGSAEGVSVGPETFGLAVPYSPEYLDLGLDTDLMTAIAEKTGGQFLPLDSASVPVIVSDGSDIAHHRGRVWWPALLAALTLLVLEIAVRRLVMPEAWLRLLRNLRSRPTRPSESQPGYAELVADITRKREAHIQALQMKTRLDVDDPAARARLYIVGHQKKQPGQRR